MAPFAGKSETIKKIYSLPDVKITKVKAIATAPYGIELVVMKLKPASWDYTAWVAPSLPVWQ